MSVRLSDRVKADRSREVFDKIMLLIVEMGVRDDARTPEEEQVACEEIWGRINDLTDNLTCNQLADVAEMYSAMEVVLIEAKRRRAQRVLFGDGGDHKMCEAERQMYVAMDELDEAL